MVRFPLVGVRSLMAIGTPWSGPSGSPAMTARSASRAWASASSGYVKQKALSAPFTSSMRARLFCTTSTGETFLSRISPASVVAGV